MTWAAVRILPSAETMTPEPRLMPAFSPIEPGRGFFQGVDDYDGRIDAAKGIADPVRFLVQRKGGCQTQKDMKRDKSPVRAAERSSGR